MKWKKKCIKGKVFSKKLVKSYNYIFVKVFLYCFAYCCSCSAESRIFKKRNQFDEFFWKYLTFNKVQLFYEGPNFNLANARSTYFVLRHHRKSTRHVVNTKLHKTALIYNCQESKIAMAFHTFKSDAKKLLIFSIGLQNSTKRIHQKGNMKSF